MHVLGAAATVAPVSLWNAVTITTAIIAGLGFLVAACGLVLAIHNLRHQSRRDFPKARWKSWWVKSGERGPIFHFTNEGAGDAIDTELWVLVGRDGDDLTWTRVKEYGAVGFGQEKTMSFTALSSTTIGRDIQVELRYRHGAKLYKVRRLRSRLRR